jgi:cell wall assembly regulator SMI1
MAASMVLASGSPCSALAWTTINARTRGANAPLKGDAAMSAAKISQLWRQLTEALARVDSAVLDNLYPGADDAAIERLRAGLTVPLPAEVEALYRANNGQGRLGLDYEGVDLFWVPNPAHVHGRNGYYFMSIDGVDGVIAEFPAMAPPKERLKWSEHYGPVRVASNRRIPFAKDFGGNFLCIDLDPDTGGKPGQIIELAFDDSRLQVVASSLAEFLESLLSRAGKTQA